MLRKAIPIVVVSTILNLAALVPLAAGAMLHDSRLVEILKDNTLSGTTASGTPYNLYFLEGGQATYADANGHHESGSWHLGENGDICLSWHDSSTPGAGCFHMTIRGREVTWTSADSEFRSVLRGAITSTYLDAGRPAAPSTGR